jgi:hypothetical protein
MKKMVPAESPDAYVKGLSGWIRQHVQDLRALTMAAAKLDEAIKWGHLVYSSNGPVLLIRAEEERVLFGFWRGQRLRDIESRLKPGGKYEMATMTLVEGTPINPRVVGKLVKAAVKLNEELGNPQLAAKHR